MLLSLTEWGIHSRYASADTQRVERTAMQDAKAYAQTYAQYLTLGSVGRGGGAQPGPVADYFAFHRKHISTELKI